MLIDVLLIWLELTIGLWLLVAFVLAAVELYKSSFYYNRPFTFKTVKKILLWPYFLYKKEY